MLVIIEAIVITMLSNRLTYNYSLVAQILLKAHLHFEFLQSIMKGD